MSTKNLNFYGSSLRFLQLLTKKLSYMIIVLCSCRENAINSLSRFSTSKFKFFPFIKILISIHCLHFSVPHPSTTQFSTKLNYYKAIIWKFSISIINLEKHTLFFSAFPRILNYGKYILLFEVNTWDIQIFIQRIHRRINFNFIGKEFSLSGC